MHVVRYVTPTLISSHFNIGENPDTLYDQTRMDGQWNFRHAYDEARKIRDAQDTFCRKVEAGAWDALESDSGSIAEFPEDLQWESLVDVLRGRVKVSSQSLIQFH